METIKGLTHEEVEEKIKQGKSNKVKIKTNESILKILRKNIFTYFNFIFLILTILLITSHSYRNLTFLIIITIKELKLGGDSSTGLFRSYTEEIYKIDSLYRKFSFEYENLKEVQHQDILDVFLANYKEKQRY